MKFNTVSELASLTDKSIKQIMSWCKDAGIEVENEHSVITDDQKIVLTNHLKEVREDEEAASKKPPSHLTNDLKLIYNSKYFYICVISLTIFGGIFSLSLIFFGGDDNTLAIFGAIFFLLPPIYSLVRVGIENEHWKGFYSLTSYIIFGFVLFMIPNDNDVMDWIRIIYFIPPIISLFIFNAVAEAANPSQHQQQQDSSNNNEPEGFFQGMKKDHQRRTRLISGKITCGNNSCGFMNKIGSRECKRCGYVFW